MRTLTYVLAVATGVFLATQFALSTEPVPAGKEGSYQVHCRFLERDFEGKETVLWEPAILVAEGEEAKAHLNWDAQEVPKQESKFTRNVPQCSLRVKVSRVSSDTVKIQARLTKSSGAFMVTGFRNILAFTLGNPGYELSQDQVSTQILRTIQCMRLGEPVVLALEKDDKGNPRCWVQMEVKAVSRTKH